MTLCLYSYYSCGQTAEYNIMLNNKVIGNIITKKFTSNNQTTYTFKSTISTKIIMRIKVITENTSIYNQAHELISCKLKATQNGKIEQDNKAVRTSNNSYQFTDTEGNVKTINEVIKYTSPVFYFKAPTTSTRHFKETNGTFSTITSSKKNTFKINNEDDSKGSYSYDERGVLTSASIQYGLFTILVLPKGTTR